MKSEYICGPENPVGTRKRIHVLIAEKALGGPLPRRAEVHHVDGNGRNNLNNNLVICQDCRYHKLLHIRTRVLKAGGNPDTDKVCFSCRLVLPKSDFGSNGAQTDGLSGYCRPCWNLYHRNLRMRRQTKTKKENRCQPTK